MEQRVLLIDEVAILLRISTTTVRRHLAQRRRGIGLFPLPISAQGGKLRWSAECVERYILSQSNTTSPNVCGSAQQKRDTKSFAQRQEAARQVLERHRKRK